MWKHPRTSAMFLFFLIMLFPFLSYLATNIGDPSFNYLVYLKSTAIVISALTVCVFLVSLFGSKLFKLRFTGMMLAFATMFYLSFLK